MGGSSDEDILEESSDESDEELAVGGNVGVSTGFPSREKLTNFRSRRALGVD